MDSALKHTPLHDWHVAHGAKMTDFGGWDMPIEYQGLVAEHQAVRESVGAFDVSHMGKVHITGENAAAWLNTVVASDLAKIGEGKAQYSMLLNAQGGVIDDLIVYVIASDDVWMVPNASNATEVFGVLQSLAVPGISLTNHHETHSIVAVQGPDSEKVLAPLNIELPDSYMSAVYAEFQGVAMLVCRTGYTGERGFEIIAPNESAIAIWEKLIAEGVTPVGLGARDTLRLEMGYPLHGHEISPTITPVEAGLSWAIGWDKPTFQGRDAVVAQRESGASRKRAALKVLGRGIPRGDMSVLRSGSVVGQTTSGTFSPTLKEGIALALVSTDVAIGHHLVLDVRGREVEVEVIKLPFVNPSVK